MENEVRIKKLNAIEALAFRSVINFDDFDASVNMMKKILECYEVKIGDEWFPIKEKGKEIYYPAEIENDIETINTLVANFLQGYLKPLFTKSNGSKV